MGDDPIFFFFEITLMKFLRIGFRLIKYSMCVATKSECISVP